jgi:hypothetical protein
MEKYVTLVAEIAEYPICVGENLRYANSVNLLVTGVNEMFKVRTATCCIVPPFLTEAATTTVML